MYPSYGTQGVGTTNLFPKFPPALELRADGAFDHDQDVPASDRSFRVEPISLAITQLQSCDCAQARSRPEAPRNAAAERSDAALTAPSTARHSTA